MFCCYFVLSEVDERTWKIKQRIRGEILCLKELRRVALRAYARMFWGDVTPVAPMRVYKNIWNYQIFT